MIDDMIDDTQLRALLADVWLTITASKERMYATDGALMVRLLTIVVLAALLAACAVARSSGGVATPTPTPTEAPFAVMIADQATLPGLEESSQGSGNPDRVRTSSRA